MLRGKNILIGVTGSIAAYKSAFLVREFIKGGANVRVVITNSAKDFITPLTLSTLSKHPVLSDFTEGSQGVWNNHVELGLWADAFIIAPASANTIAKMANGVCDNLLLATYLSAKCPVYIAPAMDLDMYKHLSTKSNLEKIKSFGNIIIPPGNGELASGLIGEGRMAEPGEIYAFVVESFSGKDSLKGKKILVTAGPTYEAIDPVRFIGNHSSGKMGIAIANELAQRGALVSLVCGPVFETIDTKGVSVTHVVSADEMYKACTKLFGKMDAAIMAAAVADYKPAKVSDKKIKKGEVDFNSIALIGTKDILKELGRLKSKNQLLVGFALETDNEINNAKKKLKEKNLDLVVMNSLKEKGAGFSHNSNKISIITKNNKVFNFELKSKSEVAKDIIKELTKLFK